MKTPLSLSKSRIWILPILILTMSFSQVKAQITLYADPDPSYAGYVTGNNGSYSYNEEAVLTAVAHNNFAFDHWETEDGDDLGTANPLVFHVTEEIQIYAVFRVNAVTWSVTAEISPSSKSNVIDSTFNLIELYLLIIFLKEFNAIK